MANENRRAGTLYFKVNGVQYDARGSFSYSLGLPKRVAQHGSDMRVVGYKNEPQTPYVEGEIYDSRDLDLAAFHALDNETVTLDLANGKGFLLRNAWNASEGMVQTGEGNSPIRFEGLSGQEI